MRRVSLILFITLLNAMLSTIVFAAQYKVAVRAHSGVEAAQKKWQATIELLNQKIPEHHFELVPMVHLDEIIEKVANREFDFLLTNPSSYVEANKFYSVQAIATLNNKRSNTAQDHFGSVIFTHVRNTNIKNIADLEGKTLMIVAEQAFGGWRVAWLEMLQQGFDPYKKLKKIKISEKSTQQDVVFSVLNKEVDAGVVRTDLLERMEMNGDIDMRYLRIINNKDISSFPFFLSSALYPEWAFSVLKHVPEKHALQVEKVLLAIKKTSQAALKGNYIGWVEPLNYQTVSVLMKRLKVGPYVSTNRNRQASSKHELKK